MKNINGVSASLYCSSPGSVNNLPSKTSVIEKKKKKRQK